MPSWTMSDAVSHRLATRAAWILIALGVVRLALLVFHEPLYGYANNYDFIRISSWFHLWPAPANPPPDFDPTHLHPQAPISSYRIDRTIDPGHYYLTSDLVFVWAALQANRALAALASSDPLRFDLRLLGLIRLFALTAAAAFVTHRFLRHSPTAGLLSAALFFFVLADPVFSLLFDTLYSDFAAILFAYLSSAQIIELAAYGPWQRLRPYLFLSLTLFLLALAKVQYLALPFVLLLFLGVVLLLHYRRDLLRRPVLLGLLIVAGAGLSAIPVQRWSIAAPGYIWSMRMSVATDTYFGAALPNFSDESEGLRLLGLPQRCRAYIGNTWFTPGMQPPPCPEIATVPRWKLGLLVLHEPRLVVRVIRKAAPLLQSFFVRYLGQVEGERHAQADLRIANGLWSIALWPERLSPGTFLLLGALTLVATLAAVGELLVPTGATAPGGPESDLALPALVAVLGLLELYSVLTAWVGAGFAGLGRHSILGQLAFLCLLPLTPIQYFRVARMCRTAMRRRGEPFVEADR